MNKEQINAAGKLIDSLISQAPAPRMAHVNGVTALSDLLAEAEKTEHLKIEVEALKKQNEAHETTIKSLNNKLSENLKKVK
jgi:hypothetical protein